MWSWWRRTPTPPDKQLQGKRQCQLPESVRVEINRAVCHPPLLLLIPILAFVAAAALVPESSTNSTMMTGYGIETSPLLL